MTTSRREFLASVGSLGVAGALWLALGCGERDPRSRRLATLVEVFSDPEAVRLVGDEVLRTRPGWADEPALADALLSSSAWDGEGAPGPILGEQIRRDFDENRVLALRGWWISESEARLFALAALEGG